MAKFEVTEVIPSYVLYTYVIDVGTEDEGEADDLFIEGSWEPVSKEIICEIGPTPREFESITTERQIRKLGE